MNRYTQPNPDYPDYETMHFQLTPDEQLVWAKLGFKHPPANAKPFIRWENDTLSIGLEPADAKAKSIKDNFDTLKDDELKQKCAMQGIAYRTDSTRTELLASLRAKPAKGKKQQEEATV